MSYQESICNPAIPLGDDTLPRGSVAAGAGPLARLVALPQWVAWRLEQKPGEPKLQKVPYNPQTGQLASSTDSTTWATFEQAQRAMASGQYSGIGFVFTAADPFVFIDLDGCRNPETGAYTDEAVRIHGMFPGAAAEVSQSGTGLHIVGSVTDKAAFADKRKRWPGGFEFYTEGRFMALGNVPEAWRGSAQTDITAAALAWVPDRPERAQGALVWGDRDPRWCGPEDDAELVRRMLDYDLADPQLAALDRAVSADPNDWLARAQRDVKEQRLSRKMGINALWNADAPRLGELFPSESGQAFDHSGADLALMNELAYWSGNDAERMLRLFDMSALARREKWQKRSDYRQFTLRRTLSSPRDVYRGNRTEQREKVKLENQAIAVESEYKIHADILSLDEMVERLYFIASGAGGGGVADAQSGFATSIAIARNEFAASVESVTIVDGRSGKERQKRVSAFELWLKDPKRKRADNLAWAPGSGILCDLPDKSGATGFNTWRGIPGVRGLDHMRQDLALRESWLQPWHGHLAYLFPVEAERRQFEQWCAHIIQRPEELPQTNWCLIATQTGIGRNWLGSVLHRVVRGHVLANVVLDGLLNGAFNGLMSHKLLVVVDEAKAGMRGAAGWQNSEKLKTLVNPEFRTINEKHGLQTVENNHSRWLVFSNHFDALPIESNDRRWNFVENPTVRQSPEYYRWLYDALRRHEFIAAVRAHLESLDLIGFNYGAVSIENPARARVMRELATDLDMYLAEFRDRWPGPVARGADLLGFVASKMTGKEHGEKVLYRAAAKAGMTVTERLGREKTRFIITDGKMIEQDVAANPAHWLMTASSAAHDFRMRDIPPDHRPGQNSMK